MYDLNRGKKLIREIVEREQPRVEVYDPRYLEYLNGEREDVPKENEEKRGVVIISL